LQEAIERIEAQLGEIDFLYDRFREIQEEVLELQKKVGIEPKLNINAIIGPVTTASGNVIKFHKSGETKRPSNIALVGARNNVTDS